VRNVNPIEIKEVVLYEATWRIDKFKDPTDEIADLLHGGMSVEEVKKLFPEAFIGHEEWKRNIALHEGLYLATRILAGIDTTSNKWDNTNARLGVGDSNVAPADEQTGLQAATNKAWKGMDATYPQCASAETDEDQFIEWRATFGSTEGNFAWEEYTVVNASNDAGKNLNRCTASKGTKASGESWTLSLKITFA